jgi:hypothetical protein
VTIDKEDQREEATVDVSVAFFMPEFISAHTSRSAKIVALLCLHENNQRFF